MREPGPWEFFFCLKFLDVNANLHPELMSTPLPGLDWPAGPNIPSLSASKQSLDEKNNSFIKEYWFISAHTSQALC